MAAINDLIAQIEDKALRDRIQEEVNRLNKQKKFGLVFEEHLPECTPLYEIPVKVGALVAKKAGKVNDVYTVLAIESDTAKCLHRESKEKQDISIEDLVCVAEFGEPIYPYLKPIDSVCNAPDSDLWHTLIEADNYHALQLLEYLYAGKVDCIYIDPPYNSRAKDWKYNNDYVDPADTYRHSKWLSFMKRRLKLAKRLLNPEDSVLIVTIDEKEYLHLGCLLEEMFPEANIQMVSSVINYTATARRNQFDRVNEFIYFVMIGECQIYPQDESKNFKQDEEVNWRSLRRQNASNIRDIQHPNQFFPIYIDVTANKIVKVGENLPFGIPVESADSIQGCETVFPIKDNGIEMMWGLSRGTFLERLSKGYVKVGRHTPNKPQKYILSFLEKGMVEGIENGEVVITGTREDGSVIAVYNTQRKVMPKTQWAFKSHDAREYGTYLLDASIGDKRFSYPKSLYAVHDCMKYFMEGKKNAIILDFFAGSGTTMHAVNLLNAEDGGNRRCIMVTNNEVSADEAKDLLEQGYKPGDEEWERLGIARYVTWPRTVCSIEGHDVNGNPLTGNYGCEQEEYTEVEGDVTDPETGRKIRGKVYKKTKKPAYPELADLQMSDGFKSNAAFFKLSFLDPTTISLGMRLKEMLPILWMKTGAKGKCPEVSETQIPDMLILPENKFAVLVNEHAFASFAERVAEKPEIQTIFLTTDYEANYRSMVKNLNVANVYQLYRDYLDHFRLNRGRD